MVGSGWEGGGGPRRSRALAFTALVAEKTSFFGLDLGMDADLLGEIQRTPDGRCGDGFRDEKNECKREGSMEFQMGAKAYPVTGLNARVLTQI
jgi:hypothetical protein